MASAESAFKKVISLTDYKNSGAEKRLKEPLIKALSTNGGKRQGAGRSVGSVNTKTLEKRAINREYKQKILESVDVLFIAQMQLARGLTYLYRVDKEPIYNKNGEVTGYRTLRPVHVTEPKEMEEYLTSLSNGDPLDSSDGESSYYFLTTKDPESRAIDSMLDRALGKAPQPLVGGDEDSEPIKLLAATRVLGKAYNDK